MNVAPMGSSDDDDEQQGIPYVVNQVIVANPNPISLDIASELLTVRWMGVVGEYS